MRIGVVSPYAWTVPGGVNNHVLNLVDQLEKRGHKVWVIAPAGNLSRSVVELPSHFVSSGRAVPVRANGSVAYVSVWPLMLQKMTRLLSRLDLDLVHVHEPTIPATGAAATMMAKVPVVGTFHAAGDASGHYERFISLARRIMACLTVNIAVSEAARDCVSSYFPGDYRLIPNGIDVGAYSIARDGEKVAGRILFIGRPEPRKGLSILVDAFAGLRRSLPGVSLVLAGPTPANLRSLVSKELGNGSGAIEGITAMGRISYEEKLGQMRQAEILCAPSLGGESFGIVLTEALAAGIPVVASDIPGYRAVLQGGEAGVLVPPGSALDLEQAMFSLLQNTNRRRELALNGVQLAELYSWERVVDQVLEAYNDALMIGSREVKDPPVPLFSQIRHSIGLRLGAGRPQSPRGQAN
jgi:phosphatidyl-myo-inositol alpha-mannosyltransferase